MFELGPRSRRVYESLRERILSGRVVVGEQLPSHRELAIEYGVAPLTMRQVLARLEYEGFVSREQGRGTFVRARAAPLVLVVSGDPDVRAVTRQAAAGLGLDVLAFEQPREALAALDRGEAVAILLCDVQLPDTPAGLSLLRSVRRGWPEVLVGALTHALGDLEDLYGTADYPSLSLAKPLQDAPLERVLRMALHLAREREAGLILTEEMNAPVLVADDDPLFRGMLRRLIEDLGYRVDEAVDGRDVRAALARRSYGHIFLDLRMPHGGLAFAEQVAAGHPASTVVLTTGHPGDLLAAPRMLFTLLPKPFEHAALVQALQLRKGRLPLTPSGRSTAPTPSPGVVPSPAGPSRLLGSGSGQAASPDEYA